jgi:hypothetical protein
MLVSPPSRHAKKRSPADLAGALISPLKAIHNELPAAAHDEGRNASCPRATSVAGAGQPGYWIPVTLGFFRSRCGRKIQYLPKAWAVNAGGGSQE